MPLFAALGGPNLTALAACLAHERHAEGQDVVREGEAGARLYVVDQGQLEVVLGRGRGQRHIDTLGEGDYFGELALLAGAPRAATVRATQPVELWSLDQTDFTALLERRPALRAAVAAVVAQRQAAIAAATIPA
jgi:CRP-like cAMP-binding protein